MLRLRGHRTEHDTQARNGTSGERRIRWAEDVVDNEGQGKKSSKGARSPSVSLGFYILLFPPVLHDVWKTVLTHAAKHIVCCIYHKPRAVGESSSEESSSDSSSDESDSDSDVDNGEARMANGSRRYRPHGRHGHGHDHDQPGSDQDSQQPGPARKKKRSRPKPNAYERMPRYSKKPHN